MRPDRWQPRARGVAVSGALAVMAGLGFGRFSYTMLLPATREGLGLDYTAAGLLGTANLAGYLAGSLLSGPLARRVGPRAAALWALVMLALGLAWMGATQGVAGATAARALAGAAGAVVYIQTLGLVAVWFPGPSRGLASGVMHSGNGMGLVLTGLGLPLVLGAAGGERWRAGWAALALATLAVLPHAWRHLRPPSGAGRPPARTAPAAAGRPVRRRPSVAVYGSLYWLFGLSYIIYVTFFAEALRARGLSLAQAGLVWSLVGALSLASGPVWGSLSDRIGRMGGLAVLFGLQAIAYGAFLGAGARGLTLSVALFGVTAWGVPAIVAAAMGDGEPADEAAAALGRITTVMGAGQAVGPFLAGTLADATGVVQSGLWISILAASCGAAASLASAASSRAAARVRT